MTDREKIIYDILCSDEQPPEGQHWEGFVTNKIIAALAQPEPEPVAWMWDVYSGAGYTSRGVDFLPTNIPSAKHTPLYAAPPKREWVGLTKDEVEAWELPDSPTVYEFAQFVEAKLKEKNAC